MRVPGASWGDVTRDGRIVAACPIDGGWALCLLPERTVLTRCPDRLMFVRVDAGPDGRLAATAQGHRDGAWWLWVEGQPWRHVGQVGGANCVEIVGTDAHWDVYGQIDATTYRVLRVVAGGAWVSLSTVTIPATSQGFCDASRPGYLLMDPVLRRGDTMQPHPAGGWLVGQHHDNPPRLVLADARGIPVRVLASGPCEAPRAVLQPDALVAADDVLVAYAMGQHEGIVLRDRVAAFPLIATATPTPTPAPTPVPPVPPPLEDDPMRLLSTVEAMRRTYGATMTDDECVDLCNRVAWQHRADGWGLSRKTSGTRGTRHDGQECAHDILVDRAGVEYDILVGAGAQSTPTWGRSGGVARPGREWVAPIAPQGTPVPSPTPTPTPGPDTPTPIPVPSPACRYAPLDLEAVRAIVREEVAAAVRSIGTGVDVVAGELAAERARAEARYAEIHRVIGEQVAGLLSAIEARGR